MNITRTIEAVSTLFLLTVCLAGTASSSITSIGLATDRRS